MTKVLFKRKTSTEIEELPIEDGSFIIDIEKGRSYTDFGDERISVGSAGNEVAISETEPINEDTKVWLNPSTNTEKYKDENGDWQEVAVRAVDYLPIGTVFEYEGTNIPDGYEEIDDNPIITETENGTLIQYNDGRLICMKTLSGNSGTLISWGNLYYKDIVAGNWAFSFVSIDNIQITNATSQFWTIISDYTNSSAGTVRIIRPDSHEQNYNIQIIAIGRWK